MRTFILALVLIVGVPVATQAQSYGSSGYGSTYDWQSGNSYNWNTDSQGNTQLRGFNLNTGSMWNQTIEPDGDQRGSDSQGNYWTYDNQTGNYFNFGTGRTCTGKGALRSCF